MKLNNLEMPPRHGNAKTLMVFLHGLGSSGEDLFALAPIFQTAFAGAHIISPNAPQAFEDEPVGYQWFSAADRTPPVLIRRAREAFAGLEQMIKPKQEELGLTNADTVLLGFSQGAMMACGAALAADDPFKAVISFCGRVIPPREIKNQATPICLIHGAEDEVIEPSALAQGAKLLEDNNIECKTHMIENLAHSIDDKSIYFSIDFLKKYGL